MNSLKFRKAVTLIALSTMLSACGSENNYIKDGRASNSTSFDGMQNYFDIGEHIISVPINEDPRNHIRQYEYHPGYKPVGISVTTYGEYFDSFGGASMTFVNTEEVVANVTGKNADGEAVFTRFGIPTDENNKPHEDGVFDVYEHIISIPINYSLDEENIQIDYIEGYELVGICDSAYGRYISSNSGGCLLYVNIVPVKVEPTNDGNNVTYANIGVPMVENTLELK